MHARPHPLVGLPVLVALYLAPTMARGVTADLTPCVGRWEGVGKDPWLDDPPYAIALDLVDGAQQCATVTYVGHCTARWVDCTVTGAASAEAPTSPTTSSLTRR